MANWEEIAVASVSLLGLITVLKHLISLLSCIWSTFLRPPKDLIGVYGPWAVITGCTDGIGKSIAFELASKGLNLVLVGRNPTKLRSTSSEIREKHGRIDIKSVEVDFARMSGEEVEQTLKRAIRGLDVGILINNAGMAVAYASYLDEQDLVDVEDVIKVNVAASTSATRAVIPGMMERRRGAIVNMGSGSASVLPSYPLSSVYGATKAYLEMLSRCTSLEYCNHGIDVQCQIPMLIATKMTRIRKSSFFTPSTDEFSKASVRCIGYDHICQPYWTHVLQSWIAALIPDALLNRLLLHHNLALRSKAIQRGYLKPKA